MEVLEDGSVRAGWVGEGKIPKVNPGHMRDTKVPGAFVRFVIGKRRETEKTGGGIAG